MDTWLTGTLNRQAGCVTLSVLDKARVMSKGPYRNTYIYIAYICNSNGSHVVPWVKSKVNSK